MDIKDDRIDDDSEPINHEDISASITDMLKPTFDSIRKITEALTLNSAQQLSGIQKNLTDNAFSGATGLTQELKGFSAYTNINNTFGGFSGLNGIVSNPASKIINELLNNMTPLREALGNYSKIQSKQLNVLSKGMMEFVNNSLSQYRLDFGLKNDDSNDCEKPLSKEKIEEICSEYNITNYDIVVGTRKWMKHPLKIYDTDNNIVDKITKWVAMQIMIFFLLLPLSPATDRIKEDICISFGITDFFEQKGVLDGIDNFFGISRESSEKPEANTQVVKEPQKNINKKKYANSNLHLASSAKKDEFYTQLSDIEKELHHYRKHFKDKVVLCNCDDPFESNFFKYFVLNFNRLGLKKLIATCYTGSPIANQKLSLLDVGGTSEEADNKPYKAVVTQVYDKTGDGGVDMLDVAELFKTHENELVELEGDGDFRSEECLALMDEADIVVTNPPFSLFREYVAILFEHKKDFIIIGSQNAITYKEIFPILRENKMWLGHGFNAGNAYFKVPDGTADNYAKGVYDSKTGLVKFRNCVWFTTLDIKKRHEELILVKRYKGHEEDYPHYDNYDAINIDKVADIPEDYDGIMGVPITFLDKYNPEQFVIIGLDRYTVPKQYLVGGRVAINGQPKYARILVRNKKPNEVK